MIENRARSFRTLLDTNVVLHLLSQSDAQHAVALNAVQAELQDQTDLILAPQVIIRQRSRNAQLLASKAKPMAPGPTRAALLRAVQRARE